MFDQAAVQALIAAAVKEAVTQTKAELDAVHEAATAGLVKNKNALLDKTKKLEAKLKDESYEDMVRRQMAESTAIGYVTNPDAPTLEISREDARTPSVWRAAKARAESEGRRLVITDSTAAPPPARQPSRVKVIETDTHYFVNRQLQEKIGFVKARAEAERKGKQYAAFRYADELPSEAQAKHAHVVKDNNPDTLLFVEP